MSLKNYVTPLSRTIHCLTLNERSKVITAAYKTLHHLASLQLSDLVCYCFAPPSSVPSIMAILHS